MNRTWMLPPKIPAPGKRGGTAGAGSAIRPLRRMREVSLATLTAGLRH
jgi:hypothetical protein